jgi:hypothetical protein
MSASIRQMYCCVVLSAVIGLATPATLRAEQPLSYRAYWKAAASPNPPNPESKLQPVLAKGASSEGASLPLQPNNDVTRRRWQRPALQPAPSLTHPFRPEGWIWMAPVIPLP